MLQRIRFLLTKQIADKTQLSAYLFETLSLQVSERTLQRQFVKLGLTDLETLLSEASATQPVTVRTRFGGAWLLIEQVKSILATAIDIFGQIPYTENVLLTVFYFCVLSMRRLFHLDDVSEAGFALLTGKRTSCSQLRVILDCGGCKGSFLARIEAMGNVIYLVRAIRWQELRSQWQHLLETEGAHEVLHPSDQDKKKELQRIIKYIETRTKVKGKKGTIRTIVIINDKAKKEKDRFYPLFTNDETTDALSLILEYRSRQNHELVFRMMVHDLYLNALPKSYPKNPKTDKPRFMSKAVWLIGWMKGLAYNSAI